MHCMPLCIEYKHHADCDNSPLTFLTFLILELEAGTTSRMPITILGICSCDAVPKPQHLFGTLEKSGTASVILQGVPESLNLFQRSSCPLGPIRSTTIIIAKQYPICQISDIRVLSTCLNE